MATSFPGFSLTRGHLVPRSSPAILENETLGTRLGIWFYINFFHNFSSIFILSCSWVLIFKRFMRCVFEQSCPLENQGKTFAPNNSPAWELFLESAVTNWHNVVAFNTPAKPRVRETFSNLSSFRSYLVFGGEYSN